MADEVEIVVPASTEPIVSSKPKAKPKPKPKPKPKVRRKPVVKAETAPAPVVSEPVIERKPEPKPAAESKPAARFVEVSKKKPRRKSSWILALVQLIFAACLVVGAYYGWSELSRVREESAQREAALRAQLGQEVGSVQQRFDSMIALLEKQKEEAAAPVKRQETVLPLSGVTIVYPATLAGADTKDGKTVFAANPDLWIDEVKDFNKAELACAKPLQITAQGYCDKVSIFGVDAVERVFVEREGDTIKRLVRSVSFASGLGGKILVRLNVDLGTPVVNGRDVFAPTDPKAQEEALQTYFRTLLKKESLPDVLAENLALFDDLVAHIRLP